MKLKSTQQVCDEQLEPRTSAVNMTPPAAAARARAADIDRYILHAPELSSKPTARRRCCRSTRQTDGRNVTSAGWQATLCDSIWHVSSSSGEASC